MPCETFSVLTQLRICTTNPFKKWKQRDLRQPRLHVRHLKNGGFCDFKEAFQVWEPHVAVIDQIDQKMRILTAQANSHATSCMVRTLSNNDRADDHCYNSFSWI